MSIDLVVIVHANADPNRHVRCKDESLYRVDGPAVAAVVVRGIPDMDFNNTNDNFGPQVNGLREMRLNVNECEVQQCVANFLQLTLLVVASLLRSSTFSPLLTLLNLLKFVAHFGVCFVLPPSMTLIHDTTRSTMMHAMLPANTPDNMEDIVKPRNLSPSPSKARRKWSTETKVIM